MKKCQDCRANNKQSFCELEYKTEVLEHKGLYSYLYLSPLEVCNKPKTKKEFIKRILATTRH